MRPATESSVDGRLGDDEVERFARLIFLSYRFSQGGIGTQNRLLLFMEEHLHPTMFASSHAEELLRRTHLMVAPYFLNQRVHPATAIPWEDKFSENPPKPPQLVDNELAGLFGRFANRSELAGFDSDIVGIAGSVLTMDENYLQRQGGRAGDSRSLMIKVSPYRRDAYQSLFIAHSVMGNTTGSVEYDHIFGKLATQEVLQALDQHAVGTLANVVELYERTHDGLSDEVVEALRDCERRAHGG